jgi:hypothetical protein
MEARSTDVVVALEVEVVEDATGSSDETVLSSPSSLLICANATPTIAPRTRTPTAIRAQEGHHRNRLHARPTGPEPSVVCCGAEVPGGALAGGGLIGVGGAAGAAYWRR